VAMPYATKEPARALIQLTDAVGNKVEIFSRVLPLNPNGEGPLQMSFESRDLSQFANQRVSIEFIVQSPGQDASGHWVAFLAPRITRGPFTSSESE
jgi:hypothetical protein